MKYRKFGSLDWEVSTLGFGTMRLPEIGKDNSIDEPLATEMIRYAIDKGVNYIDTAYPYHGMKCEAFLGRALQDGYREKIRLATKMPAFPVKTADDFDRIFDKQLENLQTDYLDFYLLHSMNRNFWSKLRDLGILSWAEKKREEGLFHHFGFSFHDDIDLFKEIIDSYDNWDLCQIQYNFLDIEHQAGTEGLKYAAEKGLAVVIMEPIRGGGFTLDPIPESINALWESAPVRRTPADWALQWVWNHPEVSVVLSGMSSMQHVVENIESANSSGPNTLTSEELSLIGQVREEYIKLNPIQCTSCNYCMPCPNGIDIPKIFSFYNNAVVYDTAKRIKFFYSKLPKEERAENCIECKECEEKCPQDVPVSEWMIKLQDWF
ncbi:MAG: aldo/keto reductase [Deltaproteobacteria bacterium]|nr:aldo/keto reductase [Deltaproteobacteria bacterium]